MENQDAITSEVEVTSTEATTASAESQIENSESTAQENTEVLEGADKTQEANSADTAIVEEQKPIEIDEEAIFERMLKKNGLDKSVFETIVKEREEQSKSESKPYDESSEKAKFIAYGAENKLFTIDDYNEVERTLKLTDIEIARTKFASDFKHSEFAETDEEKAEELEEAFNSKYKMDSDEAFIRNARDKEFREIAEAERQQKASKIEVAKNKYYQDELGRKQARLHTDIFQEVMKEPIKTVIEFEGQKIEVEVAPSADFKKDYIDKHFNIEKQNRLFEVFNNSEEQALELMKADVNYFKEQKAKDTLYNSIFQKGWEMAKEKFSIGSKEPFAKEIEAQANTPKKGVPYNEFKK